MGGRGNAPPDPRGNPDSDLIQLLVQREELLSFLDLEVVDKPTLVDVLDVSRSTVDRSIKQLQAEGIVEKRPDGYALTQYGRLTVDWYREFHSGLSTARLARDSLAALPDSSSVDTAFFRNASVIAGREDDGQRPGEYLRELLASANGFWTVTGSPHFELIQLAREKVVEEGMSFRLIHSADSIDKLFLHSPEIVKRTLESGNLSLYSHEEPPPYGLMKAARSGGETVVMVLYGHQSEAETLIVNDSGGAVARFDERFETYRDEASKIDLND